MLNYFKNFRKTSTKGMTLLEVLMSLAVFAILMTAAASSILGSIDANQKAQSINSVMSNMTVALESISRDIRVGTNYAISPDGVADQNVSSDEYFFYTDDHGIDKRISLVESILKVKNLSDLAGQDVALTASEVRINKVLFTVLVRGLGQDANGNDEYYDSQPAVRIQIWGEVNVQARTATEFYLQTLVSQRLFNDEV